MTKASLILATGNQGKVREFQQTWLKPFLKPLPSDILEPEEDGQTCQENALLKARYYTQKIGHPVLSDDSGFFIPSLNNYPGIYSSRVIQEQGSIERVFEYIAKNTSSGEPAYFECVLAIATPQGFEKTFIGQLHGTLSVPAQGTQGFGYDPIFKPQGVEDTLGQLSPEEKNAISHRAVALEKLHLWFKSSSEILVTNS